MTIEEIKIRQLTNQYLLAPSDKLTVVRGLNGVQAQFMSCAMHSLKIRCADFDPSDVGDGLVKNWTIRGTAHVFAQSDLPLYIRCNGGADYRRNEWDGFYLDENRTQLALTPGRQKYFADLILRAVSDGPRTREELKALCQENGMTEAEQYGMFGQWGGGIREMCLRGFLNYVVQEKKAFCLAPEFAPMPEEEARLEMARRYFTNIAPATVRDAQYYFHTTQARVKAWLAKLPVSSAECGGRTYYFIESGREYDKPVPKCLLLAGFDQLMLGYDKAESLYLPAERLRGIFNLAGIVLPAVLIDGRVVGKWKKSGKALRVTPFEKIPKRSLAAIERKARELWPDFNTLAVVEE